jgi:hypothetical protein
MPGEPAHRLLLAHKPLMTLIPSHRSHLDSHQAAQPRLHAPVHHTGSTPADLVSIPKSGGTGPRPRAHSADPRASNDLPASPPTGSTHTQQTLTQSSHSFRLKRRHTGRPDHSATRHPRRYHSRITRSPAQAPPEQPLPTQTTTGRPTPNCQQLVTSRIPDAPEALHSFRRSCVPRYPPPVLPTPPEIRTTTTTADTAAARTATRADRFARRTGVAQDHTATATAYRTGHLKDPLRPIPDSYPVEHPDTTQLAGRNQ